MKKSVVLLALLFMSCQISLGWGGVGHAAIAQIAENHISKSTRKVLKKCLPGTNVVEVASDADDNYYVWTRDIGFECSNSKILRRQPSDIDGYPTNIEPWCHSYSVDSLYNTYRHNREGDEYIRNAVMDLDLLIAELKTGWAEMDEDECMIKLSLVIHLIGDIHCPMHVLYVPQAPTGGKYSFTVRGEKVNAHSYWDSKLIKMLEPEWSYYEYSEAADTASPEEIAEIQKGDVYDWGKASAISSLPAHIHEPKEILSSEYPENDRALLYEQLRNAGYRLARTLDYIFEVNE